MGLDLSLSRTGLVVLEDGVNVLRSEGIRTKPSEILETRIGQISARILTEIRHFQPDMIGVEDTAFGAPFSDSRVHELAGVVKFLLWNEELVYTLVGIGTLKKFATGNGRADKVEMLEAACHYFDCRNHDLADGFWLAKYTHDKYDDLVATD